MDAALNTWGGGAGAGDGAMKSSAPPAAAAEVVTGARRATFTPRAGTPLFERDPRRAAEADAAQETAAEEAMAAIRSLFAFGRGATAMDGGRALNSGAPRRVRSSHAKSHGSDGCRPPSWRNDALQIAKVDGGERWENSPRTLVRRSIRPV